MYLHGFGRVCHKHHVQGDMHLNAFRQSKISVGKYTFKIVVSIVGVMICIIAYVLLPLLAL